MSNLLLDERPLILLPSLVRLVGMERAAVLQQVHWLATLPKSGTEHDGYKWVWGEYAEWCEMYFPFWSARTLQRHILQLEREGYLVSAQLRAQEWDRTKYYRVDYDLLEQVALAAAGTEPGDDDIADEAQASVGSGSSANKRVRHRAAPTEVRRARVRMAVEDDPQHRQASSVAPAVAPSVARVAAQPEPVPVPDVAPSNVPQAAPSNMQHVAPSNMQHVAPSNVQHVAPSNMPDVAPSNMPDVAPSNMPDVARSSICNKTSSETSTTEITPESVAETRGQPERRLRSLAIGANAPHTPRLSGRHPALLAYKELHGRWPSPAQEKIILDADIQDIDLWRKCLRRWAERGYNARRLDGVLEWYADPSRMEPPVVYRPVDANGTSNATGMPDRLTMSIAAAAASGRAPTSVAALAIQQRAVRAVAEAQARPVLTERQREMGLTEADYDAAGNLSDEAKLRAIAWMEARDKESRERNGLPPRQKVPGWI